MFKVQAYNVDTPVVTVHDFEGSQRAINARAIGYVASYDEKHTNRRGEVTDTQYVVDIHLSVSDKVIKFYFPDAKQASDFLRAVSTAVRSVR